MQKIFLAVLDMSIVASIVILTVLVVRFFLKRAPKQYSYILWAAVLFRLLCPFSIESAFSIIPERAQNLPQDVALETTEHVSVVSAVDAAQRAVGDTLNGGIDTIWVRLDSKDVGEQGISMASHVQVYLLFAGVVWPVGIAGMVLYSVVSYVKLRRKLVGAIPLETSENQGNVPVKEQDSFRKRLGERKSAIYLADHIDSPFVMGVIQPKIYLPSSLAETERDYIILHEQYHIRRGDHIAKFLAFVALCIHWFNPLVWVAFIQAGKDMEMSCDEAVIKQQGEQIRVAYSASLLKLATGKAVFAGMPLAFGEGDTKGRIRNLAKWRKPKIWISIVAVVVCILVAVVCIVNPKSDLRPDPAEVVGKYDVSRLGGAYLESSNPAYEIGANAYGMPVFADADKAWKTMKEEYKDAIAVIRERYDLMPLTKKNYNAYKIYGAQVITEIESLRKKCVAVSQFLDVYENSFQYGVVVEEELSSLTPASTTAPAPNGDGKISAKEEVFVPGTVYVTYACRYMNPLSSTLSNGDDGKRYVIGEDNLTVINRSTGNEIVYDSITWGWQPFPWTDEEWCELYFPGSLSEYAISDYYEEMFYQPISDGCCILWMDGELWLLDLNQTPQKEPYIWSIHTLMPESMKNVSQSVSINGDVTKYLGMTYQQFQEQYQSEVIHYHANFYLAQIQEGHFNVNFNASKYDETLGMAILETTDQIFRVDSKLGALLPEYDEEMSVEEFLKRILGIENVNLEHYIRQGTGTIYYVGNTYVEIGLDSDGDGMADMMLDVAVDDGNQVGPESRVWLIKSLVLSTTHPTILKH